MKEKTLQAKILKHLRSYPYAWWCKYPAGMYGQIGVPDIIGCLSGKFYAFEVKRPKGPKNAAGKPTKLQIKNIDQINSAGGHAHVVHSLEEVKNVINGN